MVVRDLEPRNRWQSRDLYNPHESSVAVEVVHAALFKEGGRDVAACMNDAVGFDIAKHSALEREPYEFVLTPPEL
jgi:hypothetical protein